MLSQESLGLLWVVTLFRMGGSTNDPQRRDGMELCHISPSSALHTSRKQHLDPPNRGKATGPAYFLSIVSGFVANQFTVPAHDLRVFHTSTELGNHQCNPEKNILAIPERKTPFATTPQAQTQT